MRQPHHHKAVNTWVRPPNRQSVPLERQARERGRWAAPGIIHGDRGTAVSYEIAARAARRRANTELATITGSDHGFDSPDREECAIALTIEWLINQRGART